ncbi:MAG: DUF4139 domain-containing protein [Rhodanobacter sp.]
MNTSLRCVLAVSIACACALGSAVSANASPAVALTVYRSDSSALYASNGDGSVGEGYAVVREQRALKLAGGIHDVVLGDLPLHIDPEAIALGFPDGGVKLISQRLLLAQGASGALTGLVGHQVFVLGSNGDSLANGTLLRAGDGLLVKGLLGTTLVRNYAAVRSGDGAFPTGSSLDLRADATRDGSTTASLSYPTAGIGWRAAYVATLQSGATCRVRFDSRASIANRSGRDWNDAQLTLVAGEPNMAKPSAPRPMMAMARGFSAKAESMPQQESLGDYRSFTLPAPVSLPDGSVSQVPLYATRTLACVRTTLLENGNSFQPQQPNLNRESYEGSGAIVSTLKLAAFDSLPAGYLRVLTSDSHGVPQFIGEGRINDTPKGSDATITLGTPFDLRATRSRTSFHVDKQGRTLDEAFSIELGNAGDSPRVVTVREHPSRWREWKLVSSSSKPASQTGDSLDFQVDVPAHGKATLNYAVRYSWTTDVQPQ